MKVKSFFILNRKKVLIVIFTFFVSVLLHNLISGLLGVEEVLFFLMAVIIIPVYIVVSVVWTFINSYGPQKIS
jgi:hypothetical protein